MAGEGALDAMPQAQSPSVVVALVLGPVERRQLAAALRDIAPLVICDTLAELLDRVGRGDVGTVIAELRDAAGLGTGAALASLRVRWPNLRVLLYVALLPDDVHALADFVSAGTVIRGVDDIGRAARRAATGPVARSASAAIAAATAPFVSPPLRSFFAVCAALGDRQLSVRRAALGAQLPYRTLFTYLQRSGLPSPRSIVAWHRLLHAAWEADVAPRTRDEVARRLIFSSGSALSHLLMHHTGLTWRALRANGGFHHLLQRFTDRLGAARRTREAEPRYPSAGSA